MKKFFCEQFTSVKWEKGAKKEGARSEKRENFYLFFTALSYFLNQKTVYLYIE